MEMTQLTSIVSHTDGELIACTHFLGVVYSRTTAVGLDALYMEVLTTFVTEFERGSNRLFKARTTTLYSGSLYNQLLCRS